jgi:hypothetical protein
MYRRYTRSINKYNLIEIYNMKKKQHTFPMVVVVDDEVENMVVVV